MVYIQLSTGITHTKIGVLWEYGKKPRENLTRRINPLKIIKK